MKTSLIYIKKVPKRDTTGTSFSGGKSNSIGFTTEKKNSFELHYQIRRYA